MNPLNRFVRLGALFLILVFSLDISHVGLTLGQQQPTNSLEDQLGFTDTTIEQLQAQGMDTIGENIEFTAFGHNYHLLSVMPHTIPTNDGSSIGGGAVLLYKLTDNPTLIWKRFLNGEQPILAGTSDKTNTLPPPGNWNTENNIFFAFALVSNTSKWDSYLIYINQLRSDDTVISPLSNSIPPGYIVTSVQAKPNGIILLNAEDIRWQGAMGVSACCGPRIQHYFEWQDNLFVDVSAQHYEDYFGQIGSLIYTLTTWQFNTLEEENLKLYAKDLFELLMIYDTIHERENGWLLVQNLIIQTKASHPLSDGSYLDQVFIPAITQSYNSDTPFVPPESQPVKNYYTEQTPPI